MQDEADLAAALFFELRAQLMRAYQEKREGLKRTQVGVITPYRQQRSCLMDTFRALCREHASEVGLNDLPAPLHCKPDCSSQHAQVSVAMARRHADCRGCAKHSSSS